MIRFFYKDLNSLKLNGGDVDVMWLWCSWFLRFLLVTLIKVEFILEDYYDEQNKPQPQLFVVVLKQEVEKTQKSAEVGWLKHLSSLNFRFLQHCKKVNKKLSQLKKV